MAAEDRIDGRPLRLPPWLWQLGLANLVEPKVMGGIVGLVLAVPATAVALRLLDRLRAAGVFQQVAASIEIIRRG